MDYSSLSNEELMKIAGIGNQPLSVRNNNPGNLRPLGSDKGFQSFSSPQDGMNAMMRDLEIKVSGNSNAMKSRFGANYTPTIETLISTWAPPTENNTAAYINAVSKNSGIAPNQPLNVQDVERIAPAMIKHEGGNKAVAYYNVNNVTSEPDYSSFSDEDLMKAAGIEMPAPAVQQPAPKNTYGSRIQADFQKRKAAMKQAADDNTAGKQSFGSAYLQTAGNIAAIPVDAAIETISTGYKSLPDEIKPNQEMIDSIGSGIGKAANYVSDSAVGDVARQYAGENPVAMKNLEAVGNIASVIPLVGAARVAGKPIVDAAGNVLSKAPEVAAKTLDKLATPKYILPNSEQLAEMGGKAYKAASDKGEFFDGVSDNFISSVDSAKPGKVGGVVERSVSEDIEAGLGKYRDLKGKPISIDDVDSIDKELSDLKQQAYGQNKNLLAGKYADIQNSLRQSVAEAPSGQTLAQARDFYRRKYQMEDVERIFRNAEGRPNEAAIIQTGYRNLANQARKKGSGYTKEQIELMDKAAKGGLSLDALKLMSSKLIPVVAGASGNVAGAGVAYMGNIAAGAGATALQTAKANKLAKSIAGGVKVQAEPSKVNKSAAALQKAFQDRKAAKNPAAEKPALMLPAPTTTVFVDKSGRAIPLTQAEREIIGQMPSEFVNPVMQEVAKLPPDEAKALLDKYLQSVKTRKSPR